MCLAIPMKVVSMEGGRAMAEQEGVRRAISVGLLDEVKTGDYVLVHAGYAIARVDEEEALRTLELVRNLAEPAAAPGADDEAR
jgi:hydrogenase expression/formation protein HypC